MPARRVAIFAEDIHMTGGTTFVTQVACRVLMERGYKPVVYYLSLRDKFKFCRRATMFEGIPMVGVGYIPVAAYVDHALVSTLCLRGEFIAYEACIALGGTTRSAGAFLAQGLGYTCWFGTTASDEWAAKSLGRGWSLGELRTFRDYYLLRLLNLWMEKRICVYAQRCIAQSEATRRSVILQLGVPPDSVRVIPVPVDTDRFRPADTRRLGSPLGSQYLLCVTRPKDPRKNVRMLLDAFLEIHAAHPTIHLVITGDASPRLQRFCTEAGIEKVVHFTGIVSLSELVHLYQFATLSLVPSLQEGLGIAVLESLACGVPVVSTPCGGPEDLIVHGRTGLLTSSYDKGSFAEAVIWLLGKPSLLREMGAAARKDAEERFSIHALRDELAHALIGSSLDCESTVPSAVFRYDR